MMITIIIIINLHCTCACVYRPATVNDISDSYS